MIRRCRAGSATRAAATWSTAAWRCTGQGLRRHLRRPHGRHRCRHRQRCGARHHRRPPPFYTITGAPRVVKGKVIIGNGGAEYGARLCHRLRRRHRRAEVALVHGARRPGQALREQAMAKAAKTQDPSGKYWVNGGGGTVWNSMAFDPGLNLLYIGTGNGGRGAASSAAQRVATTSTASIVALDPDTGKYVWHYRETPGTTPTTPRPRTSSGRPEDRRAAAQGHPARAQERFLLRHRPHQRQVHLGGNFVDVNWASGYDRDGRPIETPLFDTSGKPVDAVPAVRRAQLARHVVQPAAGPAYIPAQHVPLTLADDKRWEHNQKDSAEAHSGVGWNLGMLVNEAPPGKPFGRLIAWDPVRQKAAAAGLCQPVERRHADHGRQAGVQGTADGRFIAYDAATGEKLWQAPTGTGVVAPPVTYLVDGKQYVSVAVGWGGVFGLSARATDRRGAGHGVHLRPRRQAKSTGVERVSDGGAAERRQVRPRSRRGRQEALRQQLRVLPRGAGRRQGRQHPQRPMSARARSSISTRCCSTAPSSRAACRTSPAS